MLMVSKTPSPLKSETQTDLKKEQFQVFVCKVIQIIQ